MRDVDPHLRAPCSRSARAPAISVPPVVVTSSPTIATLSRTRPVTSVTDACSCAGRVLCMTAKSASIISAKRTAMLRATRVRRHRDHALAVEAQVAEVPREERQRGHVVDRDREEALDLPRVEIHRQHAVGPGELQHVGDEARRRSAPAASPCGPGASTGTTG